MSHGADCPKCGHASCECYEIEQAEKAKNKFAKLKLSDIMVARNEIDYCFRTLNAQVMNKQGFNALESLEKTITKLLGD